MRIRRLSRHRRDCSRDAARGSAAPGALDGCAPWAIRRLRRRSANASGTPRTTAAEAYRRRPVDPLPVRAPLACVPTRGFLNDRPRAQAFTSRPADEFTLSSFSVQPSVSQPFHHHFNNILKGTDHLNFKKTSTTVLNKLGGEKKYSTFIILHFIIFNTTLL